MDTLTPQEVNPQIVERPAPSFLQKYKFTIISLVIILIALIPLIMLARNNKKTPLPVAQQTQTTPTVAPLTQQNAQPTLDAVDAKIQAALDQSNTDLQQSSQVNTGGDSTSGL